MTPHQFRIINAFHLAKQKRFAEMTAEEIARKVGCPTGQFGCELDALRKEELVVALPLDGRNVTYQLTPMGKAIVMGGMIA